MEARVWPRVMVVTDRRRLTAARGLPLDAWPAQVRAQIRGAVRGGADLIQVREPDLAAGALAGFLRSVFREVPEARARLVVNDRADVARAVGAAGVHLPERSLSIGDVRRLEAPDTWVVGRSVHSAAAAEGSASADYLLAGTVTSSASKPTDWPVLGWAGVPPIVAAAGGIPVVVIGGLTGRDVGQALRAGAVGVAAIGAFIPFGQGDLTEMVQERVEAMRLAFDTSGDVSYTRGTDR